MELIKIFIYSISNGKEESTIRNEESPSILNKLIENQEKLIFPFAHLIIII